MFRVGEHVRLKNGHTRMVILHVQSYGVYRVKYDNPKWPVSDSDFANPQTATNTYTRNERDLVKWDGLPGAYKLSEGKTMSNRYRAKPLSGLSIEGENRGRTSTGLMIIETDKGELFTMDPTLMEVVIPYTFKVRGFANRSYYCHYTLPHGFSVGVGDVLVSSTGNAYIVEELNTNWSNPKGQFTGRRMAVAEEIG